MRQQQQQQPRGASHGSRAPKRREASSVQAKQNQRAAGCSQPPCTKQGAPGAWCSKRGNSLAGATAPPDARGETTRCSLRRVSAMGAPLVQLSHPARLRGAESGIA
jgi:hypothetical protein